MRLSKRLALVALLPISSAFAAETQTAVLDVQNMTCSLCPVTIKVALKKVPGVEDAAVNFEHKTATVKFDPAKASIGALVKASTDAGFPATVHK